MSQIFLLAIPVVVVKVGQMTHPDLPVLRACCEILAIWAEAYTSDVQVARACRLLIEQNAIV